MREDFSLPATYFWKPVENGTDMRGASYAP
jgi:hypothetical protein